MEGGCRQKNTIYIQNKERGCMERQRKGLPITVPPPATTIKLFRENFISFIFIHIVVCRYIYTIGHLVKKRSLFYILLSVITYFRSLSKRKGSALHIYCCQSVHAFGNLVKEMGQRYINSVISWYTLWFTYLKTFKERSQN